MRYEVYLDTVFIVQLVMDYCILRLTASFMKLKTTVFRVFLAALAGAAGSCIIFLPVGINGSLKFIVVFTGVGLIMTGIAFRLRGVRHYLCMVLTVSAFTFLFGGVVCRIVLLTGQRVTFGIWIGVILLVYILLQSGLHHYRRQKDLFVPVTLLIKEGEKEQKLSVIALKDTGNRLREPATGKAVCILEQGVADLKEEKTYLVPFHTLGNESDAMRAQMIPEMIIHTKEGDIAAKDVMIALYPGKISKKDAYHMILHPEYLKED